MFQGGFVGTEMQIQQIQDEKFIDIGDIVDFQDNNNMQFVHVSAVDTLSNQWKLLFPVSSDFYGRITIYNLELFAVKENA